MLTEPVWEHIPGGHPATAQALSERMAARVERPNPAATWIVTVDGTLVGTTSHFPEDRDRDAVEIGATYLAPGTWGTGLNQRVKALMIDAARTAGATWIRLRTDERNLRSARAIQKLGAVPDGERLEDIIRADGSRRTSQLFRLVRD